jgi:hypothetical protein
VFGVNVRAAVLAGFVASKEDHAASFFGEACKHNFIGVSLRPPRTFEQQWGVPPTTQITDHVGNLNIHLRQRFLHALHAGGLTVVQLSFTALPGLFDQKCHLLESSGDNLRL